MKRPLKYILSTLSVLFCILLGFYLLDPNRMETKEKLVPVGKPTSRDFMLSSVNVTSIAQDNQKLIWIGTSAGINIYNGKDYLQFFHDNKDTTALPDDYINVIHRDKLGRMWVGTQNGVARYEGGYRFHRFALPTSNNILQIVDTPGKGGDNQENSSVIVSNGKENFLIFPRGIEPYKGKIAPRKIPTTEIPMESLILKKPKELISCIFKDAGGNLFVGYRNAGFQIISKNILTYSLANDNPLAKTTASKDITCLETVGSQVLAGTTMRLYVYDYDTKKLSCTFYKDLFKNISTNKQELLYLVGMDTNHVCMIGNHEIISSQARNSLLSEEAHITKLPQLGNATHIGSTIYACCDAPYIIRYEYGAKTVARIAINNQWYDEETQLTTLQDGNLLLFMKNMHLALLHPQTGKITEITLQDIDQRDNIDPAFVRQDSHGRIWLGTKRYGLYRLNLAQKKVERMNFISDVHIQGLQEDKQGQLWITTLKDAICYHPATGEVLMNSLVSSSQNEWNRQYFDNSLCIAPDGNITLGSSDGCIFLPPASGNKESIANKQTLANKQVSYDNSTTLKKGLCINAIDIQTADGRKLTVNNHRTRYTFAHDENDLSFYFYYPNFSRRSSMQYQYILEGYDKQWRTPTYETTAHFANLSPGKYTFRVRLISSVNQPALAERDIEVIIKPAIWASSAAWLLYLTLIGLFIHYINSLYLRIRTNRLLLVQEQHEREREQHTNEMNMSFFANISHEFRNPITIIAGPLLALNTDTSLSPRVHETINRVCLSVNRMLRLIDQMLDFNQLETDALRLKVSEADAIQELRNLVSTFEESTKVRHITLETHFSQEEMTVWLDTDKFEKILSNLFTNALKHTPEQGTIQISASLDAEKQMFTVSVYNSGSEIEEDKLQDVFKRYYQLADTQGTHHYGWGTGIGLYYVKRLVGLHHGDIQVWNVPLAINNQQEREKGVEFSFHLPTNKDAYKDSERNQPSSKVMQIPIRPSEMEPQQEATSPMVEAPSLEGAKKTKILIVDDDIDVAQYIRSIFATDYIVENRYSAEEALADMEKIAPDIILSDIIMGKMSGYEFCKTLKSDLMFSHIPVILITAKSNLSEQIDGLRLGAVAYVTKPFAPSYLKVLVESQLHNMQTLRKRLGESTDTEALAETVADSLSEQDHKFMDELYSLMEKRAAEYDLNVATICRDLLISQSKFTYKLKELTGETPGSFFRKYKLNKAAQLLHEGKYNVTEIATMVGFSTAAHFSVAFKKQFGVSPSDYH